MTHEEVRAINKIDRTIMDEEIQPVEAVEEAVPAVEEEVSAPATEEVTEAAPAEAPAEEVA